MDARFPVQWLLDRRLQQLTDVHHRAFVNALVWSVANRTDGHVGPDDIPLIPRMNDDAADVFVAAQLWTALENGWRINDFESTQTSRAEHQVLEHARKKEREKKARQRAAKAEDEPAGQNPVPGDSPQGRPGGLSRGHVPWTTQEGRQAGRQAKRATSLEKVTYARAHEKPNGADPYTPSAEELARIEANLRAGYDQ